MQKRQVLALVLVAAGALSISAQEEQRLTVEELFNLVETNNKGLRAEKTGVQFADQGVAAAKSQKLPDVNTSLSMAYQGNVLITNREFGDVHGYHSPHFGNSFSVEAQQVVYAGGAVDAGIRMAELRREQAAVGEQTVRQQQRFLVLGQFLDLCKLGNRIQVYRKNIELTTRLIDDIRAKHDQGMVLKNDITRYELQLENLRLGLKKVEDSRDILNHQLCNALGIAPVSIRPELPAQGFTPSASASSQSPGSESYWQQEALLNSPMIQQAVVANQLAMTDERLARSEQLPKVAVVAADHLNGPFTYDIPPKNINYNYWYVGIGVQYPISGLFKSNKKVQQARTAIRQSEERHEVVAEQLNNAVQAAYTLYRQAFVELDTQQKSVQLASQNYQVVNDRYLNQLALITDMIDASNIKLDAELREVDARINILYNYYKMKYIAGTL